MNLRRRPEKKLAVCNSPLIRLCRNPAFDRQVHIVLGRYKLSSNRLIIEANSSSLWRPNTVLHYGDVGGGGPRPFLVSEP